MHKCHDPEDVCEYIDKLVNSSPSECFYNPANLLHAYIETGDGKEIFTIYIVTIVFTVIGLLFDLLLVVFLLFFRGLKH